MDKIRAGLGSGAVCLRERPTQWNAEFTVVTGHSVESMRLDAFQLERKLLHPGRFPYCPHTLVMCLGVWLEWHLMHPFNLRQQSPTGKGDLQSPDTGLAIGHLCAIK